MTDGPKDPFTGLGAGAVGLHEMYVSFTAAGFDPAQALYLVGVALAAAIRASQSPPADQ